MTRSGLMRRTAARVALAAALLVSACSLGHSPPSSLSADPAVDVLVWGRSADVAAAAVRKTGAMVDAPLPIVGGVAARLDARQRAAVAAAGLHVVDDMPLEVADLETGSAPAGGHQLAAINPGDGWDLDAGAGVGVALVDTGVAEVADLAGRVVHGPNLSGESTPQDTYGHGTFMAGLIAGDGALSAGSSSRHVGVAPGAHIVSVKVAGADGNTSLVRLLNAIGWVVENGDAHAIRVLNLSVAMPPLSSSYVADPLSAAVEAAWASGITVVAAAGNEGSYVTSPGRDPWVITAGALDIGAAIGPADDSVPSWSGRQVNTWGAKPELLAPGVSVVSLLAPGSAVARAHPDSIVDGHYLRGSGTSMAAAMVSGAVAVLTERHAGATPDDFKGALVNTSHALDGDLGGVIDLAAADQAPVDAGGSWWQTKPLAFDGLGVGLVDRMPWADARWEGTRWAGTRWAGTRWAGTRWAGTRWAGTRWAGTRWAGTRWAEGEWVGTRWAGTRWAGTRWAGGFADHGWAGSQP